MDLCFLKYGVRRFLVCIQDDKRHLFNASIEFSFFLQEDRFEHRVHRRS